MLTGVTCLPIVANTLGTYALWKTHWNIRFILVKLLLHSLGANILKCEGVAEFWSEAIWEEVREIQIEQVGLWCPDIYNMGAL